MASSAAPDHIRLVTLHVNGEPATLALEPRQVLLDVLRRELQLTGTKEVCEMGNCGACTVLVDGAPVYSCLVLAVECEDATIETIEGLSRGQELTAAQRAFVECDALQCGFCTPGQVMSLEALLRRDPHPDEDTVTHALSGNLCRCGAYRHILAAAHHAAGLDGGEG